MAKTAKSKSATEPKNLDTASITSGMGHFRDYAAKLKGDEKGEAQLFLNKLFQAFGHHGTIEAGAVPEDRLKSKTSSTKFLDLHWPERVLFEMKKRGERLEKHYDQAFRYWMNLVPHRPPFVVLCNFDEFWIYDFNIQLDEPMDRVRVKDLESRWAPLRFMLPTPQAPLFNNNVVEVTRDAANSMATLFQTLVHRGEERDRAQRFVLQCVVAMFSEDVDLLPRATFTDVCADILAGKGSSYDFIGGLFRQMNNPTPARGGRFQSVRYFNGGLFAVVDPIELTSDEVRVIQDAAKHNWGNVHPGIFGSLFQASMDAAERHAFGAHFTGESDIQKVVEPTITRPWRQRIDSATTLKELKEIRRDMSAFQVLDPACGSGNFLYVAYRSMKRLERDLLAKVAENFSGKEAQQVGGTAISLRQFHGIDILPYAVDLARVTMILAKETTLVEQRRSREQADLQIEPPLPLDNLDEIIVRDDAILSKWPAAHVIIGNPPYQSKNKIQQEMGAAYVKRIRAALPEVPGLADFCVYWIRKAHDHIKLGGRVGLVGTNTIRENQSRVGGLDYIVANGGTITEAVSSQVWPGEANLHVSIVNWVKGSVPGNKVLFAQRGNRTDSPWQRWELPHIGASLSERTDVSSAKKLITNANSACCYQGKTPGHDGFLLPVEEARAMVSKRTSNAQVVLPYMSGDHVLGAVDGAYLPRWVIDFSGFDVVEASKFKEPFERVQRLILPARQLAANDEIKRNKEALAENPKAKVNRHHANFLNRWWCLSYERGELSAKLSTMPRYIACCRHTKRPIFWFAEVGVNPNDSLTVFPLPDDYSFGILQSATHWGWFTERCSTLEERFRYTSDSVFDSFPWPQSPTLVQVRKIADAAIALCRERSRLITANNLSLRDLYRTLDSPGKNPLRDVHEALDVAVRNAYGLPKGVDELAFLLELNATLAAREAKRHPIQGPGLPTIVTNPADFITSGCLVKRP